MMGGLKGSEFQGTYRADEAKLSFTVTSQPSTFGQQSVWGVLSPPFGDGVTLSCCRQVFTAPPNRPCTKITSA